LILQRLFLSLAPSLFSASGSAWAVLQLNGTAVARAALPSAPDAEGHVFCEDALGEPTIISEKAPQNARFSD
jgi:hypothetical protein